ncbi:MAG TPA: alpha,alpha-trehalose-phosphate synthase (UDP-forming) [Alphaproteobacteria bacterium]
MARVVVVSNRVDVPSKDGGARAGGLAVALRSFLKRNHGIWFGWSGRVTAKGEEAVRAVEHAGVTYITTDLARADFQEYYNGFANRMLWPILHYRLDLAEFSNRDLSGYLRVNALFADQLHKILKPDDVIWVHDYHLLPLAKGLRERGHENKIGFYLHVPFPPPEVLTALPKHERVILSLCHYDLVGFQTDVDADNFARYLTNECRVPSRDRRTFTAGTRTMRIGVFPVGVETAEFERLARRTVRLEFVREVLASLADRSMIIGVDRLDYSKGIGLRVRAFEDFLAAYPRWRGAVTYLQITPRSRSEIREYAEMERRISETVGRVNGRYGEASWTPIRYVNRPYSRSALAGLYRSSRAALVTPLRDGMNLVAKEYVAAQNADDPGVLILSRFAGSARECTAALLVNPYDSEGVGNAINRALSMSLEERRQRHAVNFKVLTQNDLSHWAERFLQTLEQPVAADAPAPMRAATGR